MEEIFYEVIRKSRGKSNPKREKRKRREEEDEKEGISRKEIREGIKMLKDGKTMGTDKILGKAWRYGREEMEE